MKDGRSLVELAVGISATAMELSKPSHCLFVVLLIFALHNCLSSTLAIEERTINEATTLECHVRQYKYTVTKEPILMPDGRILECSGQVVVDSCWGRCDSSEIPDFKVPYKLSDHPVCTYGKISRRIVSLDNCHPEYPDTEHEVIDAVWCSCSVCTGNDTSCQTLNS